MADDAGPSATAAPSAEGSRFGPYLVGRKIGKGNFGEVYAGVHSRTHEAVAIKVEPDSGRRQLPGEARAYHAVGGEPGFAKMRWFGRARGQLALVMDRLGPSLRSVHRAAGLRLSVAAVAHVAAQSLERLEALHEAGWLHLDLKPANLLLPRRAASARAPAAAATPPPTLTCIDFGSARPWFDGATGAHVPPARRRGVVGTGRYASLANHEGEGLGRRDDLESLGFMLAYLRVGSLPWCGLTAPTKAERFQLMLERKRATGLAALAAHAELPPPFLGYLTAVRSLRYDERPPYAALRELLAEMQGPPGGEAARGGAAAPSGWR